LHNSNRTLQENDAKITGWSSFSPSELAGRLGNHSNFIFLSLNFHVISGGFSLFSSAVAGLAEVFMPGQTVIAIPCNYAYFTLFSVL
jgi:hypothetical protein